jgi:hypothetical protein
MVKIDYRCILFSCYVLVQLVKYEARTIGEPSLTVKSNFSMCDLANAKVVSSDIDCESLNVKNVVNKKPELYYILHQRAHPIEGMLVFCEVKFFYAFMFK